MRKDLREVTTNFNLTAVAQRTRRLLATCYEEGIIYLGLIYCRIGELFNCRIDELMNWGIDGSEFGVRSSMFGVIARSGTKVKLICRFTATACPDNFGKAILGVNS